MKVLKRCVTKNELGDIIFKGKYREKKTEKKIYGLIIDRLMSKLLVEFDIENQKYLVTLANGMDVSFTKESFESIYDLIEVEDSEVWRMNNALL